VKISDVFHPYDYLFLFSGVGRAFEDILLQIQPYSSRDYYELFRKNPRLMLSTIDYSKIKWNKPKKRIKKGLVYGACILIFRACCRIIAIVMYDNSVENILVTSLDSMFQKIKYFITQYRIFVKGDVSNFKIVNLSRGYEHAVQGFASRAFLQFSKIFVRLMFTIYQRQIGKPKVNDDDFHLSVQKFASHISYGVGEVIAFSTINGVLLSFIDDKSTGKKIILFILVLFLDLFYTAKFAVLFQTYSESILHLDRVVGGKTRIGYQK